MKIIKTLIAFATLLLTTTITAQAEDYALINSYPLLNDMKMAKKQEELLNTMRTIISSHKSNDKSELQQLKNQFTSVIKGLSDGDKSLNLHGTELVILKNKIQTIQLFWSQEKSILDSALNNRIYKDEAYATINTLVKDLTSLNRLYTQSYARYKQNSVMKSLVQSYMRSATDIEPIYAFNTIK